MQTATPTSIAETSEVMRDAATRGLCVLVRGRGTKLTWGNPPSRVDLVLDLSRLDRVVDHAAGDLIVEVEAGARLWDVQRHVGRAGQRLGIDETVPGASVGGTIATATSGPLRLLTGTVRDLLIGVTLVRADGVIARAGGRVVKNVAGYDLGKLVTGSYGTLAVVVGAVLRLHPLPHARAVVTVTDAPLALVAALAGSQLVPSGIEMDRPVTGPVTVAVAFEGVPDGVAGRVSAALRIVAASGAREAVTRTDPPAWWGTYPWRSGDTALKLTFVRSGLADVVRAAADTGVHLRGSAAVGVLYGALAAGTPDDAVTAVDVLRGVCTRHGGSLVVLDAPPRVKAALDVWGPVPALDLMRRVKDRFDPEHRLAPGRFVGGI